MVAVIIPVFLTLKYPVYILGVPHLLIRILSICLFLAGTMLFTSTLILFDKEGKGTLAPWHPTKHIVKSGIYRHSRNPMYLSVFTILFSEFLFTYNFGMLIWLLLFIMISGLYVIKVEEPHLKKRFGNIYDEYMMKTPRWF